MATNGSSNPARQSVLELVEILKRLGAHRRAMHEQTYGNPPWTRDQSDAYWYHPLVRACEWLEQRVGISRHDLEDAAFRLTAPQGLRGMGPLTGPGGRTTDAGQPDLLWMFPKFRELDRDGTTARLWQWLVEKHPAILEEAGVPTETQPPAVEPLDAKVGGVTWQDTAQRLERLRENGAAFKGAKYYIDQFGCGKTTLYKAIKLTPSLRPWAMPESTTAPKAQSINPVVTDNTAQQCEADPSETMTDDEAQATLRQLIEQAPEEQRPELHKLANLPPNELRRCMKPYADADDLHNRVLGRRP